MARELSGLGELLVAELAVAVAEGLLIFAVALARRGQEAGPVACGGPC